MKLILVGRCGSGKTSVIESLLGTIPVGNGQSYTVTRYGSPLTIADSPGFFSASYDKQACTMKLAECVYSFTPGPDAFGLVIRIGRFTAEERKMIDIYRETFGEEVFRFTILIFTRLDDLLYDNVSLDEFLSDCTSEIGDVLTLCGGRYVGFDNSGSWELRTGYGQSLVSMIQTLQKMNNSIYTVDMLEKAMILKMKKEEEEMKLREESHRKVKEEMKESMRQELQHQIRRDIEEKLSREERERKLMVQTFPQKETLNTKQNDRQISLETRGSSHNQLKYSNPANQLQILKHKVDQTSDDNTRILFIGRSGSGKSSVIESIIGSRLTSHNHIHTATRFGSKLILAETYGFFSNSYDLNTCTMNLAESVNSLHPGPDVFGLVIRIGRYTDEEKKVVKLFRETLGDDALKFTILIFTQLDDLIYDKISLHDFLKNGSAEMNELLALCGERYIGFDNTGSPEKRTEYSQSFVAMTKTLRMKNNGVYTVDMLQRATTLKMKKEEEDRKTEEESQRRLKEEMKESMKKELQHQMRREIEEKLFREEQEEQQSSGRPQKDDKKEGLVIYYETQDNISRPRHNTRIDEERGSPKKQKKEVKEKRQKPPLKPKPNQKVKKENKSGNLATEAVRPLSPEAEEKPPPESGAAVRPKRSGFVGRIISFFESMRF